MFNMLHKELLLQDPIAYQNFPRLNREQFDNLLKLIKPIITDMFIFIINRFHNKDIFYIHSISKQLAPETKTLYYVYFSNRIILCYFNYRLLNVTCHYVYCAYLMRRLIIK